MQLLRVRDFRGSRKMTTRRPSSSWDGLYDSGTRYGNLVRRSRTLTSTYVLQNEDSRASDMCKTVMRFANAPRRDNFICLRADIWYWTDVSLSEIRCRPSVYTVPRRLFRHPFFPHPDFSLFLPLGLSVIALLFHRGNRDWYFWSLDTLVT